MTSLISKYNKELDKTTININNKLYSLLEKIKKNKINNSIFSAEEMVMYFILQGLEEYLNGNTGSSSNITPDLKYSERISNIGYYLDMYPPSEPGPTIGKLRDALGNKKFLDFLVYQVALSSEAFESPSNYARILTYLASLGVKKQSDFVESLLMNADPYDPLLDDLSNYYKIS
ncbi:MAG: hypothetical protein ACTSXF_15310 [Promethearchaeota archaeon]